MALLWSLLFVSPLIILSTLVHAIASSLASIFDASGQRQLKVARVWARSLLWITGVRVDVEGLERICSNCKYVFVANHLSYMDTPVVLSYIPAPFRFLAKKGLFQIPFLGWHLARAGHIPVPREDPRASLKTLSRAAELIHSGGISLWVFPEGGRSDDGTLKEFVDGAAYLAIKARAPIVPIALIGTREILAMGSATFHRGRVRVRIGEPIPTENLKLHDRSKLTETARERIVQMLES